MIFNHEIDKNSHGSSGKPKKHPQDNQKWMVVLGFST